MVTIINFSIRENGEGKSFVSLELQGEIEMIQSASTGRFYATARRCSIPSTFTEEIAKTLVGKQIRGRIERVQTEPYEYNVRESGEVITLTHSYAYSPEEQPTPVSTPASSLVGA